MEGIVVGEAVLTVYPPKKLEYDEDKDNNRSLVITLEYGTVRMLFAGDAERERIEEVITQIDDLQFDLLKVPHHGHYEKNSAKLFRAVMPEYAVICVDREDKNDGPDEEVIEALEQYGAQVMVTGDGAVHCVSDGKKLSVSQ